MILVLNCGSQSIKWKVFDQELNLAEEGSCVVLNQNNFQKLLENEFILLITFVFHLSNYWL